MKKTQFIVKVAGKEERKEFYEYIMNIYKLEKWYPFFKKRFISNSFPFVVDFKEKSLWISESVTCCACAASQGVIYTVDQFKAMTKNGYEKYER